MPGEGYEGLVQDGIDGLRWAGGLHVQGVPDNPTPARIIEVGWIDANNECGIARGRDTIAELIERGVLVVVPLGNYQSQHTGFPADCEGVVAVAAVGELGLKTMESSFGRRAAISAFSGDPLPEAAYFGRDVLSRQLSTRGLAEEALSSLPPALIGAQPGEQQWQLLNRQNELLSDQGLRVISNSGITGPQNAVWLEHHRGATSMAAPRVAAVASLMLDANPALTQAQLKEGLQRSAMPHARPDSTLAPRHKNSIGDDVPVEPWLTECDPNTNAKQQRCVCTPSSCGPGEVDPIEAVRYAKDPEHYKAPEVRAPRPGAWKLDAAAAIGRMLDGLF